MPITRKTPKKGKMSIVATYSISVFGSPEGYETNRSQIQLYNEHMKNVASLRFNDPGMFFENDGFLGDIILMHLPSSMFQSVLDILRNESPVYIGWIEGRGSLVTDLGLVGGEH